MGSSTRALPTHYEVLGLSPIASEHEIAQAFVRAMGTFAARPAAAAARIALAFETLRNPAKRRAYDSSLGIGAEPQRRDLPAAVSFRISARPVDGRVEVEQHVGEARAAAPRPAVPVEDGGSEPRVASFIASALREIASPSPLAPPAEPRSQPLDQKPAPAADWQPLGVHTAEAENAGEMRAGAVPVKRAALVAGGLVLAAGVIGTLTALWVREPEPAQAQPAVTLAVPPAKVRQASAAPSLGTQFESQPQRAEHAHVSQQLKHPTIAQQQEATTTGELAEDQPTETAPVDATAQSGAAVDESGAQDATAQPVAASLPLPNSVIARTIERIGYSCGDVSSTTAVEGSGLGVYKVTCTSGQSYQAKPIRGRYHFRRLRGQ